MKTHTRDGTYDMGTPLAPQPEDRTKNLRLGVPWEWYVRERYWESLSQWESWRHRDVMDH